MNFCICLCLCKWYCACNNLIIWMIVRRIIYRWIGFVSRRLALRVWSLEPGSRRWARSGKHCWKVYLPIIIIIITRPKPAYGRRGLVGWLGQDTDQAGTFWGLLNVSLRASGAQLGLRPKKKPTWRLENQPAIVKHHKNPPGTIVAFVWFFSSVSF